jgi:hypothetical protein
MICHIFVTSLRTTNKAWEALTDLFIVNASMQSNNFAMVHLMEMMGVQRGSTFHLLALLRTKHQKIKGIYNFLQVSSNEVVQESKL